MFAAGFEPRFEREYGCTETEWLYWLPGAARAHALTVSAPGAARVDIGAGTLQLRWTALPPRRIALLSMPRLAVRFEFDGVAAEAGAAFMRYFDLYMQRGGG